MSGLNEETKVQRNYKDTVFRMLFRDSMNLLSLYNALNGTTYTDVRSLEITTLENAVYMNYKNDISFVFDFRLMLYEHQSTANPNMPLRDLFYVARVLERRTKDQNLYGSAMINIPAPRFVVFYNGTDHQPEKKILKLSDAYEKKPDSPELELVVTVYNINLGNNQELMKACHLLREYAEYVELVRTLAKRMPFPEAVEQAVDHCIRNGILEEFLSDNRAEAIAMSIFEYNEEQHLKSEREQAYRSGKMEGIEEGKREGLEEGKREGLEEGKREGIAEGRREGMKEGLRMGESRLAELLQILSAEGRDDDIRRAVSDQMCRERLYQEKRIDL